jgi:cation transport protein ChaC
MRLQPGHLERLIPLIADEDGLLPAGAAPCTDEDFRRFVTDILGGSDGSGQVWVFAYGSLIWKPAFDFVEVRTGLLHGWHRAFCLGWNTRFRGSQQHPGLMLALDRGGRCKGAAYRLPSDRVEENLDRLVRREMSYKPSAFPPRWVKVQSEQGPFPALTFCIDRHSGRYVSGLGEEDVARVLARAVGARGSMAEYLYNTVHHLEQMGIRDAHLWRLQELVAHELEAMG